MIGRRPFAGCFSLALVAAFNAIYKWFQGLGSSHDLPDYARDMTANRRLAIRAAKFDPKPTATFVRRDKTLRRNLGNEGENEGPIRIPLHSLLFLFNALAFLGIPSNSLKFRPVVFSIFTAPSNSLGLCENFHVGRTLTGHLVHFK